MVYLFPTQILATPIILLIYITFLVYVNTETQKVNLIIFSSQIYFVTSYHGSHSHPPDWSVLIAGKKSSVLSPHKSPSNMLGVQNFFNHVPIFINFDFQFSMVVLVFCCVSFPQYTELNILLVWDFWCTLLTIFKPWLQRPWQFVNHCLEYTFWIFW